MDNQTALLGIIEVLSAISCGIFILFFTNKLIKNYGHKKLGIEKSNLAYNILIASILFSVGYIMSGIIDPIINNFRILTNRDLGTLNLIFKFIYMGGLYVALAYILSMITILIGISIYTYSTPLDELSEIKNNNIGVALIVSAIIIVLAMLTKSGIQIIIESLIPYPELPNL